LIYESIPFLNRGEKVKTFLHLIAFFNLASISCIYAMEKEPTLFNEIKLPHTVVSLDYIGWGDGTTDKNEFCSVHHIPTNCSYLIHVNLNNGRSFGKIIGQCFDRTKNNGGTFIPSDLAKEIRDTLTMISAIRKHNAQNPALAYEAGKPLLQLLHQHLSKK
jgi:hypothetical protein